MIKQFYFPLIVVLSIVVGFPAGQINAQASGSTTEQAESDTLGLNFPEFMELAIERSKELQARRQQVGIAETRRSQAKASRFLPNLELTSGHGLIPGVKAEDTEFENSSLYLDPNLRTDWGDWAVFNRVEVSAIQPIYTWGALSSAIQASKAGVTVASAEYDGRRSNYEMDLFQLYQAHLLATELKQLTEEARETIRSAERELENLLEEGSDEIDDADLYQLDIFKHQFEAQVVEVDENLTFVRRAWQLALGGQEIEPSTTYQPDTPFIDPLMDAPAELQVYRQTALNNRPEIRRINAAQEAAGYGLKAARAQRYPALVMGLSYRYAYASNRPRQRNPFISNPANTESLTVGLGIRQNLNFFILDSRVERARLQYRQAGYAQEAAADGIELDIADKYKNAEIARAKMQASRSALDVSRKWLRQEQLDYDIGFGDVNNLVDAVRQNLELEAEFKQRVYDYNIALAQLYKAGGRQLQQLYSADSQ
jgi:outer membrane protein TolC